jgi:hypothetical protein
MKRFPFAAALACAVTLGIYAACARLGTAVFGNDDPTEAVYNRMIDGFAQGHLYLRRDVPAGFAQLADPYDPAQNAPYRVPPYFLYDLSYYRGHFYAYFSPLPALAVFWPYHLLTGGYLSYKAAAAFLSSLGFLAAAWLFLDARRRYAPAMPELLAAALLVAVGLCTALPTLLVRVDVWEIPIACASALTLVLLASLWQAHHQPGRRTAWLAVSSLVLGLIVASRPTAIFLVPLLALPLWPGQGDQPGRPGLKLLAAAAIPLGLCLAALAAFNYARFGSVLEFGLSYQLPTGINAQQNHLFNPAYLWDNFRIYFLHPATWKAAFPFITSPAKIPLRAGHAEPEFTFGALLNVPLIWLALAAWPGTRKKSGLFFLTLAFLWIAFTQTGVLLLLSGSVSRYEVELLTPFVLLAAVALLGSESAAAASIPFRGLWLALAAFSTTFNLAHAANYAVQARVGGVSWAMVHEKLPAALDHLDVLLVLEPRNAGFHNERGLVLAMSGQLPAALDEFRAAVRWDPHAIYARHNLGRALLQAGDQAGAIREFEENLRLDPSDAAARAYLQQIRAAQPAAAPSPAP